MAYSEDATVANTFNAASGSFNYTVSATSEGGIEARFSLNNGATVSACSYGGNALTLIGRTINPSASAVEIWGLKNPPSGSNLLAWTLTGTDKHVVAATGLGGVNQTVPWRGYTGATGNSAAPSVTITGTTVEHRVHDCVGAIEGPAG